MLPSQVGAIDPFGWRSGQAPNRPGVGVIGLLSILSLLILLSTGPLFAQARVKKGKFVRPKPSGSPEAQSLTNIPLPVGHEAKGLVLPDFGTDGRLRGKFAAKTARRIDEGHVGFQELEILTYTPENQVDLQIDMHTGVLDLKTRILSSNERTLIKRADFNIAGDSVQFDTDKKIGRLSGNVKMVLTQQSRLIRKDGE